MTSRTKALLVIAVVLLLLVGGPLTIYFGAQAFARHVPGDGLLTIDLAGPIPEITPDSPFGDLFSERVISRQDLRDALVKAAGDRRIRAVRVRVGEVQAGVATLQEIRGLIEKMGKTGKKTFAFIETAGEGGPGNGQYYLAAACQKVVLGPLGDVNLTALSARVPFIRGTLDKLGIEPEVPGIGDYKTARFFFTERGFTPADREMTGWLLGSISEQLVSGIAAGRGVSPSVVANLVRNGPYLGSQALDLKLVDEIADWSTFTDECKRLGSKSGRRQLDEVSLGHYLKSGRPDRSGTPIAVVVATGSIMRGPSGYSPMPLFGGDVMGSETIARAWRQVADSNAKAAIFRIDSPGGSAIASEIIRVEMERVAKDIPVIVSMGDVAASGGYWITCGARTIVADPGTITASIGVYGGHFAMEHFWEDKLGVTWGRIDMEANSSQFGSLSPWTPAQRAVNQRWLDNIYSSFLDRVTQARHMRREAVDAVGRGRVYTGQQAKERGLVDVIGGFDAALAEARKAAKLSADQPVELVFYPRIKPFMQRLLERNDDDAHLATAVKGLVAGKVNVPGPVWMPPIEIK